MPGMDGIEATRRILAENHRPTPRVLILTTFDLDEYVYDALRAGASGFLLKDVPARQLAAGVRTVGEGDALLAPIITRRLIEQFTAPRTPTEQTPGLDELTPRELEVFQLLATGMSQQRNRHQARRRRDNHQDARHPDPDETRGPRPCPSGRPRLRDRHSQPPAQPNQPTAEIWRTAPRTGNTSRDNTATHCSFTVTLRARRPSVAAHTDQPGMLHSRRPDLSARKRRDS